MIINELAIIICDFRFEFIPQTSLMNINLFLFELTTLNIKILTDFAFQSWYKVVGVQLIALLDMVVQLFFDFGVPIVIGPNFR